VQLCRKWGKLLGILRDFLPELLLLTLIAATMEDSMEVVVAWSHKQIFYYYL